MEIRIVNIWKPIGFTKNWEQCSTVRLGTILPSWVRKRQTLKDDAREFVVFMERLKRQHAIETGIVEKLYDLSEGLTETFIKEGFIESYLQHGDTNIPTGQLMAYLQDNFDAIDFVFDIVKNNRPITKGFIKELHQLITKHQDSAEGRDQFGNRLQIPLLKGAFKERENNPTKADGTSFIYCPPIHVEAEMDRLVDILADLEKKEIKPILIATWLHHAFVTIHPFQDGNGRIARLLTSLVLLKYNLFPLTVRRHEKKRYIDALEAADMDNPQALVDYFSEIQKRNIEAALNLKLEVELSPASFSEVIDIFSRKLTADINKDKIDLGRLSNIEQHRIELFALCSGIINDTIALIKKRINGNAELSLKEWGFKTGKDGHRYMSAVAEYSEKHNYFYNTNFPEAGFIVHIKLPKANTYNLIISLHHFGYDDSTLAIAAVLENINTPISGEQFNNIRLLEIEPYTTSLEKDNAGAMPYFDEIKTHLQNIMTLALAQIASELS